MALDMVTQIFLSFYEERPRNQHLNDPNVQARALIDVYDFVKIIREQEAKIVRLEEELSSVKWLASRVTDDGSTKFIG